MSNSDCLHYTIYRVNNTVWCSDCTRIIQEREYGTLIVRSNARIKVLESRLDSLVERFENLMNWVQE